MTISNSLVADLSKILFECQLVSSFGICFERGMQDYRISNLGRTIFAYLGLKEWIKWMRVCKDFTKDPIFVAFMPFGQGFGEVLLDVMGKEKDHCKNASLIGGNILSFLTIKERMEIRGICRKSSRDFPSDIRPKTLLFQANEIDKELAEPVTKKQLKSLEYSPGLKDKTYLYLRNGNDFFTALLGQTNKSREVSSQLKWSIHKPVEAICENAFIARDLSWSGTRKMDERFIGYDCN